MKLKIITFFLISLLFAACSSSQETAKNEEEGQEPEIYVFDDVTDVESDSAEVAQEDTIPEPEPVQEIKYYVQVGAFTTKDRADAFVAENQSKIKHQMEISYSDDVMLYVIQLQPFDTREQAEEVRNELWQVSTFNDAFILTK